MAARNRSLTDTLCTQCGLCCDGSLFAEVELDGDDEAAGLELLGLDVEEDDGDCGLLMQPCRALKGTRCSIYLHRPDCCRKFECRLLQQVGRGLVDVGRARETIADARSRIERIEALLAALGRRDPRLPLRERCLEALARFDERDHEPKARRARDELEAAMTSLDRLVQQAFLRESGER